MRKHLTLKVPTHCNMIIAYLGRNVKEYRKNFLQYIGKLDLRCPECGCRSMFHDSYDRHIHIGESIEWITLYRVICTGCRKTHAVIPDFIRPYKHYSACDIELALRDCEDGIPVEKVDATASVSTVRRWIAEFQERSRQAAGALRSLLYRLYEKTLNELELAGMKIFALLEYLISKFPEIESSHLAIGDTNLWVTNHMAGIFV